MPLHAHCVSPWWTPSSAITSESTGALLKTSRRLRVQPRIIRCSAHKETRHNVLLYDSDPLP